MSFMTSDFFERLRKDSRFRIKVFLCVSFICNIAYALFLFVIGESYSAKWFFVISVYYGLLSIVRILVFSQISPKKRLVTKIKVIRICGYFLFIINLVFSIMALVLIQEGKNVDYHEITVIAIATYTFSTLTVAIVNSVRYIKKKDYLHACVKLISLVSASVSILTLTDTMLSTFGEDNALLKSIILPILSVAVAVLILFCAVAMIRNANVYLRKLSDEKE